MYQNAFLTMKKNPLLNAETLSGRTGDREAGMAQGLFMSSVYLYFSAL